MANPYTLMRENIEFALENHAGLMALGFAIRKWDHSGAQRVENPAADRKRWIRIDTVALKDEPFWTNGVTRTTQDLQIVLCLPVQEGKKLEDIEELFYQVKRALTPLTRHNLASPVDEFAGLSLSGGDVAFTETSVPGKESGANLVWCCVFRATVTYEEAVADLSA
ncbi:MAG TPA: hypothetical protein PKY77_05770 [Phycisphaerae bacterium]|nr:hypothetical protein [Phycisphaerae bacterium]HRY69048.1 hypothetical protein [Phycisphaerae bacterium]HSA25977.1 hypothetical protein [Phycisphaerae bacterium]